MTKKSDEEYIYIMIRVESITLTQMKQWWLLIKIASSYALFSQKIPNSAKILPVNVSAAELHVHGLSAKHTHTKKRRNLCRFFYAEVKTRSKKTCKSVCLFVGFLNPQNKAEMGCDLTE